MLFRVAWGKFIQTGIYDVHAHFETKFCHLDSTNTNWFWFVDTFDHSQTSLQHGYPCDFMKWWIWNRFFFLTWYMIWGNFNQDEGISSCISGELHVNIKRTHSRRGKAKEWHLKYELFQHKRGISQLRRNSVNPTKVLYFRRPNWSYKADKLLSFHCLPSPPFSRDQHFPIPVNRQQVPLLHVTVNDILKAVGKQKGQIFSWWCRSTSSKHNINVSGNLSTLKSFAENKWVYWCINFC